MNRTRAPIIVGIVAAFVAAFAAIGLVSRSTGSNTAATTATVVSSTSGTAPSAHVVLDDGRLAVRPEPARARDERRPLPLDRRRQDLAADRPEGVQRDERRAERRQAARRRRPHGRRREPGRQHRQGARGRQRPGARRDEQRRRQDLDAGAPEGAAELGAAGARDRPGRARRSTPCSRTAGSTPRPTAASRSSSPSAKLGIPPWAIAITQGNRFVGGDMDTGAYSSANGTNWQRTPYKDSRGGKMVMEYAVKPSDSSDRPDERLRRRAVDRRRQDLAPGAEVERDVRPRRVVGQLEGHRLRGRLRRLGLEAPTTRGKTWSKVR